LIEDVGKREGDAKPVDWLLLKLSPSNESFRRIIGSDEARKEKRGNDIDEE